MVMTERVRTELMSGREVVASGRYPYTGRLGILSPEDWEKVDEAIALVHAKEVQEQDFMKISDGQRQRLMLARAIAQDTKILVLDEPTAAMGIRESHQTLELLKRLRAEGVTQVLVSHNIFQVFDVADRIYVMRSGKMVADVMTKSSSPEQLHALILAQENREVAG